MVLGLVTLASGRPEPASQEKNIFILAGQSNMSGRGPNNCTYCKPGPNILRFSAGLQWEQAKDPLHRDIDLGKKNAVGPGMPFATRVLEREPNFGVIGLVPCAIGATSLEQWKKDSKLYNFMIARARASLKEEGVIRAMLWYQGENDNNASDLTKHYAERFCNMVDDIRSDLQIPNLPVIQVAINKELEWADGELRKQQLGTNHPYVKTVDAAGDWIHLDTAGETHVGQLLADSFLDNFA